MSPLQRIGRWRTSMAGFTASDSGRPLTHRTGNGRAESVQGGPSAATKRHTWFFDPRIDPSVSMGFKNYLANQQHAAKTPLLHRK